VNKHIRVIEVTSCYECPHGESLMFCKLLNNDEKIPLLGVSEDCPLPTKHNYVASGVRDNLMKVFGKSGEDYGKLEK